MATPARISVIVPTLNEAARIGPQLDALLGLPRPADLHEILVVDGGSTDDTCAQVQARAAAQGRGRVRLLHAPRGRARQLNAGARAATGEILLFLHADVRLPADASAVILATLHRPGVVAGAFRTWTLPDGPQRRWLGPLLHLADLRSRWSRSPYGDQALFVWRDAFWQGGGFPPLPLLEDLALARRLWRVGRVVLAPARVQVSGRRLQAHPLYYTAAMNTFPLLFAAGVPVEWLAARYHPER